MRRYIARNHNGNIFPVMGFYLSKMKYRSSERKLNFWLWVAFFSFFISPLFFFMSLVRFFQIYNREVHEVFFINRFVKAKYEEILSPVTNKNMFSALGYRIPPELLEEHIAIVNSEDPDRKKELANKNKTMEKKLDMQFGFDIGTLTVHLVFIGTTGAGKTSALITLFSDVIKAGAGFTVIDGKGDIDIEFMIYNLCKKHKYETQFFAIILNEPDKNPDSNTYSQILSFKTARKTSEFIGEFLGSGGGDGNHSYFMNRGKVMLGTVTMFFKNRQKYYNENFSLNDLQMGANLKEMSNIYYLSYIILKKLEETIIEKSNNDMTFKRILRSALKTKTPQLNEFKNIESLYSFINQNSRHLRFVEKAIGIEYNFLADAFEGFLALHAYISGISPTWINMAHAVAKAINLVVTKEQKRNILYNEESPITMMDIRAIYQQLKDENSGYSLSLENLKKKEDGITESDIKEYKAALGIGEKQASETVENLSSQAVQQHSYSEQQWSRLFDLFQEYVKVLGTTEPDVDGEYISKNNQVLYIMLPVLSASLDQTAMLGKMFILSYKINASNALGGGKQAISPTQFRIYQNKIKPNPIHIIVADELGSYIPENLLSILLSQIRALRYSMILSIQDIVSMRYGSDDRELKRILANSGKILLQNRDEDTEKIANLLPETEFLETEVNTRSALSDRVIDTRKLMLKKEKIFNVGITTRFRKGLGVYIDAAREEPVYFQSYYKSDKSKGSLQIRTYVGADELLAA